VNDSTGDSIFGLVRRVIVDATANHSVGSADSVRVYHIDLVLLISGDPVAQLSVGTLVIVGCQSSVLLRNCRILSLDPLLTPISSSWRCPARVAIPICALLVVLNVFLDELRILPCDRGEKAYSLICVGQLFSQETNLSLKVIDLPSFGVIIFDRFV